MEIKVCGFHARNADGYRIYRPYGLDRYLFLAILAEMQFEYENGEKEIAKPGACMLYTPGVYQCYYAKKEFFNSFVEFTCDREWLDRFSIPHNRIFYPDHFEIYNQQIRNIHQEALGKAPYREEMMASYLEQLLIRLDRCSRTVDPDHESNPELYQKFDSVRMKMIWQCQESWTTEKLCSLVNFEKSRFYQLYRKFFSTTPKEDLIQARLQLALYHMTNTAIHIQTAAYLAGFQNINHFNRVFKENFGCTPSEYRKRNSMEGKDLDE